MPSLNLQEQAITRTTTTTMTDKNDNMESSMSQPVGATHLPATTTNTGSGSSSSQPTTVLQGRRSNGVNHPHHPNTTGGTTIGGNHHTSMTLGTEVTLIDMKTMRFLIMDAPKEGNIHVYLKEMDKYHVTDVVRVCEPTYRTITLQNAGIHLHEMEYKDGSSPSKELIISWLQLVEKTFYTTTTTTASATSNSLPCIAVHCVAGLGRAPVMVAIALIEFLNMDPIDAVRYIRERRRGAINNNQLNYLQSYKKIYKKHNKKLNGNSCGCIIS